MLNTGVNANWLLTGQGDMFTTESSAVEPMCGTRHILNTPSYSARSYHSVTGAGQGPARSGLNSYPFSLLAPPIKAFGDMGIHHLAGLALLVPLVALLILG